MSTTPSTAVTLKMAIATQGHTAALKDGSIAPEGVRFELVEVVPQIAAFRRMVRETEFDVCEMSPTTYLTARAFDKPFTAIPVFLGRQFHNNALVHNARSGVREAKDFEGKRVGVRAYTVATGVWVRGTLRYEYGVDIDKVTWVTDDEEHVTEFKAPPNVITAPGGKSLVELLLANENAAAFTGAAGVGRSGPPTANWERAAGAAAPARIEDSPDLQPLRPNVGDVEIERYKRTGIYPIHGVIVVKDSVLQQYPWVGASLFKAFKDAKNAYVRRLNTSGPTTPQDEAVLQRQKILGGDPLPYGIEQNRSSLEAMITFAHDQKLIPRKFAVDEVFAAGTLDLK
jgi:4,5-dihydroxyphthalate decarboxylase